MTTGPAGPNSPTVVWARRSPGAGNRRRSRSANAGSSSAPTPGSTTTAGCAAAPSGDAAASRPISPWPPPSSPCALCFEPPGTATAGMAGQDHRASADLLADALILQRQLWRCLSAGSVVSGAGLGLASSAPPGPAGGVIEVGPRSADEGVEQAPQFGHGQRDELAGSGCGPPFSAVARVADR